MLDQVIEYSAVLCNALYLILISFKRISAWIFGMIASALMMVSFIRGQLNAEAFLMLFYIGAGIYGYINWKKESQSSKNNEVKIIEWSPLKHTVFVVACIALSAIIYLVIKQIPGSKKPLIDSFTSGFAILTTYLVTIKELHNWFYWIIINSVTLYLYIDREYEVYAIQTVVFTIMSIYGYYQWIKLYKKQNA